VEASTQISKAVVGGGKGRLYVTEFRLLQIAPEKAMHEDMRMKLKIQWRLQEIGDARSMEHVPRTAVCSEISQPRLEVMWAKL
jgi:hypothetical protein